MELRINRVRINRSRPVATMDDFLVGFKDGIFILWHPFHVRMDSPCQDPAPELVRPQHNGLEKLKM